MQRDVQLVTQRQQLLHSCCIAWIIVESHRPDKTI
jgi:hypothetical protein